MMQIALTIDSPKHPGRPDICVNPFDAVTFQGGSQVTFTGDVQPIPVLYYRWYSSLNADVDESTAQYSLQGAVQITNPADPVKVTPSQRGWAMGSHLITLGATDMPRETLSDLKQVRYAAFTGGASGDGACIMHVLKAEILLVKAGSTSDGPTLEVKARAPVPWCHDAEARDIYLLYNRLMFDWHLVFSGGVSVPVRTDTVTFGIDADHGAHGTWVFNLATQQPPLQLAASVDVVLTVRHRDHPDDHPATDTVLGVRLA